MLGRSHVGEATTYVSVLTPELGLVHARAQSLRKPGAKLAAALTTFAESSVVLVHGKEGWRIAGAVLEENWFTRLVDLNARLAAGRVSGLLLRLVPGETHDPALFAVMRGFFDALAQLPGRAYEAEVLAALRVLRALGLDAGEIPGDTTDFTAQVLDRVGETRTECIARINHGIAASGL